METTERADSALLNDRCHDCGTALAPAQGWRLVQAWDQTERVLCAACYRADRRCVYGDAADLVEQAQGGYDRSWQ